MAGSLENIDSIVIQSWTQSQELSKLTFLFLTPKVPQNFSLYLVGNSGNFVPLS